MKMELSRVNSAESWQEAECNCLSAYPVATVAGRCRRGDTNHLLISCAIEMDDDTRLN
jgi:hypothetical protein